MSQAVRKSASRRAQSGFSLLEMLISVGILSAAAYVALDMVEGNADNTRAEITHARLEKIRKAIVGDPDLSLNGSPMISGFVADTGSLPQCLEALITNTSACSNVYPDFEEKNGLISFGWRGPYLRPSMLRGGDGWRNDDPNLDPSKNHGFHLFTQENQSRDELHVISVGPDRVFELDAEEVPTDDASNNDNIEMEEILPSEYLLKASMLDIGLAPQTAVAADTKFCAAVAAPDPNDPSDWALYYSEILTFETGDDVRKKFDFSVDDTVTIGLRTAIIYPHVIQDNGFPVLGASDCKPQGVSSKDTIVAHVDAKKVSLLIGPRQTPMLTLFLN